jgi:hypothetical protein
VSQGQQQRQPNIVTDWITDDDTAHRLEAALTDIEVSGPGGIQQRLVAVHNTEYPQQVLTCTKSELAAFAQSAAGGSIGKMLATSSSGRPGQ